MQRTPRLACSAANGAENGVDLPDAVYAYNHSARYVAAVFTLAAVYAGAAGASGGD